MKNYQVVEYSVSQGCFHTHTLTDMINVNIGSIVNKKSSDYLPIGMFETYEEASDFIQKIRPKIEATKQPSPLPIEDKNKKNDL